ncbi:hypothetical protein IV454_25065 [Massilia antarctica]|uniref:Tetratricopeptide repeat protein n=1 Tax=Massilia antarctica TaxID=2765360 RepID=A0AA49A735_9BURK|nr:hypothetical protein [Massilia antarctica]QPI48751.1 hypothetical protein IV454_25065 [Massilia antarctica]
MQPSLQFNAQRIGTGPALRELIENISRGGTCAVADLSLGTWTKQALATQLLGQLVGQEVSLKSGSEHVAGSAGDSMSLAIDQEGRGNISVLSAFGTAQQIARLLQKRPAQLFIVCPRFGIAWRYADHLLIEYLRVLHGALDLTLVVVGDEPCTWPENWEVSEHGSAPTLPASGRRSLVSMLPSAIPPSILKTLSDDDMGAMIPLANGWALVMPESRRDSADPAVRFTPDEVASMAHTSMRHFRAYAMLHADKEAVDSRVLCSEGWKHIESGYRELALSYMDMAEAKASSPAEKMAYRTQKQFMHITLSNFKAAANIDDPDPALPPDLLGTLLELKGWGLVMSGSHQAALPYLTKALAMFEPKAMDKTYLFLMNITAFAHLRNGDHEAAFKLEKRIEQLLDDPTLGDARIAFVNSINLARLYRYRGELDESQTYYGRAFSTVEGGRTDTDAVNVNLCLLRVEEARGNTREAMLCWIRAALHWCASECPEALNWRVHPLILNKGGVIDVKGIRQAYDLVDSLAAGFLSNLKKFAESGVTSAAVEETQAGGCDFFFDEAISSVKVMTRYVGGHGWGVMAATGCGEKRDYGGNYAALTRWLSAWIAGQAGQAAEQCYVIDRRDGTEMPRNWPEMLNSAAEFKITHLVYDGKHVEITPVQLDALEQKRAVKLNPLVAHIEQDDSKMVLHYKRYLPQFALTGEEQLLLRALLNEPHVGSARHALDAAGFHMERVDPLIARLRKMRVLQVSRPDSAAMPMAV